jgi:hypothetical protein
VLRIATERLAAGLPVIMKVTYPDEHCDVCPRHRRGASGVRRPADCPVRRRPWRPFRRHAPVPRCRDGTDRTSSRCRFRKLLRTQRSRDDLSTEISRAQAAHSKPFQHQDALLVAYANRKETNDNLNAASGSGVENRSLSGRCPAPAPAMKTRRAAGVEKRVTKSECPEGRTGPFLRRSGA